MAKSARCCQLEPSRCFATWYMVSRFNLLLCHFCAVVLLTRLSARCLPSSWPDTASIRSCLSLPPGFLDTREAGNCARSRACALFLNLLDCFLHVMTCARWVSCGLRRRSLHAMPKIGGPAAIVTLFSIPHFLDSAPFSTLFSRYALARSKCDTS